MNPADPAAVPPPEWATDMARDHLSPGGWLHGRTLPDGVKDRVYTLARLLASVREGALREAAAMCTDMAARYRAVGFGTDNGVCEDVCEELAYEILLILHTPPSGGAG